MIPSFKTALRYCQWAYDLSAEEHVEIIERGNSQAVLRRVKADKWSVVQVGIAGTNDIEDITQAAQFCGRRNRHLGFYSHSLRLKKAIEKRISKNDIVFLYGHSLGGVTAQFISLDLAGYCQRCYVYSIGAPKGFRKPFYLPSYLDWYILVNDLDLVQDYPILKPFDWLSMQSMNLNNLKVLIVQNSRFRSKFLTRTCKVVAPALASFAPISTSYERIKQFHSLKKYEELLHAKETQIQAAYGKLSRDRTNSRS